jgi:hypothetical protein
LVRLAIGRSTVGLRCQRISPLSTSNSTPAAGGRFSRGFTGSGNDAGSSANRESTIRRAASPEFPGMPSALVAFL